MFRNVHPFVSNSIIIFCSLNFLWMILQPETMISMYSYVFSLTHSRDPAYAAPSNAVRMRREWSNLVIHMSNPISLLLGLFVQMAGPVSRTEKVVHQCVGYLAITLSIFGALTGIRFALTEHYGKDPLIAMAVTVLVIIVAALVQAVQRRLVEHARLMKLWLYEMIMISFGFRALLLLIGRFQHYGEEVYDYAFSVMCLFSIYVLPVVYLVKPQFFDPVDGLYQDEIKGKTKSKSISCEREVEVVKTKKSATKRNKK